MSELIVADNDYYALAREVNAYGERVQKALEAFVSAMQSVRSDSIKGGEFARSIDVFATHVEVCAQKPGMYAEDLSATLVKYANEISSADITIY